MHQVHAFAAPPDATKECAFRKTQMGAAQKSQLDLSYSGACIRSCGTSSKRKHAITTRSSGMEKITRVGIGSGAEGCAVAAHKNICELGRFSVNFRALADQLALTAVLLMSKFRMLHPTSE